MSWSLRRRLIILTAITVVLALLVGGFYFLNIHKAPSCTDGKQNQNEEGIDCGGSCSYLCSVSQTEPSVRFVRPLTPAMGRTDVIAYIDNPNSGTAIHNLGYTIELYSATNAVIASKDGMTDLPPASTVPVFVPNFFSGSETVARAFITFKEKPLMWYPYQDTRILPRVKDISIVPGDTPRITATAVNPSARNLTNMTFIITVFDSTGNAIAASQTIAPLIPALSFAPLTFTWTAPFTGSVARIEVLPVVPLTSFPNP